MATINFVVPPVQARVFSGGLYCISRYACGLRALGHQVNFIPLLPSPRPEWIQGDFGWMPDGSRGAVWRSVRRELAALLHISRDETRRKSRVIKQQLVTALALAKPRLLTPLMERAAQISYVGAQIPDADVTVATSYESALAVKLKGKGKLFYFAQHYEPYFANEARDPSLAMREAEMSYLLGLNMIANSSWLRLKLQSEARLTEVAMCANAIDHGIFFGDVNVVEEPQSEVLREVRVISYGGRDARWKGFEEMALAMNIARRTLPDWNVRWLVYGSALLPPDNAIATYEPLGFLQPPALAAAYRSADLLLSASWYESFPLFPIEAMACGLPVITTQPGTEEYAIQGVTAAVVEANNPNDVANALVKLIRDRDHRLTIAAAGRAKSQEFTWGRSVACMESLLLDGNKVA